jgi:hypothetical protein
MRSAEPPDTRAVPGVIIDNSGPEKQRKPLKKNETRSVGKGRQK